MSAKLFISADMEGLACVSDRTEVNRKSFYPGARHCRQGDAAHRKPGRTS